MTLPRQANLPDSYAAAGESALTERIVARKAELADRLLILCHHYQQEAVFAHADVTGDSLKLAREAASARDRRFIVFCGVHFMAESADILTATDQAVILPDLRAGCSMADMAGHVEVAEAWQELSGAIGHDVRVTPITYVNSSARLKALVGEKGGSVCTSSNAERVLTWGLSRGDKVFFFPDEHLGRNSAAALGIPGNEVVRWQRGKPLGGSTVAALKRAKVILWNGYCTVHMQFQVEHVRNWRVKEPDIRVIVHPECCYEVVQEADLYGSTEKIIQAVREAPAGSQWAIGTEVNLVNRLARLHPDKGIHSLSPFQCLCSTMYRIKPTYLLWVLDNLAQGQIVNQITVDQEIATRAKIALDRMLEI